MRPPFFRFSNAVAWAAYWLAIIAGSVLVIAFLVAMLIADANADRYWYRTRLPSPHVSVIYLDEIEGGADYLGRFYDYGYGFGVITIRKGLPQHIEQCVLKHEQHHATGYDHVSARMPFIDCSDGNFISAETLRREGIL